MFKFLFIIFIFFINITIAKGKGFECKKKSLRHEMSSNFCFFSVNKSNKEKTNLESYIKKLKKKRKTKNTFGLEYNEIVVNEFYADGEDSNTVQSAFEKMLSTTHCDSIIISGDHLGTKFYKEKPLQNKYKKMESLDLNLMERFSCKPGCANWFSNVNSLFLMGSNTVKTDAHLKHSKSADELSNKWNSNSAYSSINQAYSSALDQNNKLSHRYLRMFPNASLYGWGKMAPNHDLEAQSSFIKFIQTLSPDKKDDYQSILNFINYMNLPKNKCQAAKKWTQHFGKNLANKIPTACYLDQRTKSKIIHLSNRKIQRLGCELTRKINSDNTTAKDIKFKIDEIMNASDNQIEPYFNKLISIISFNKNKPWYKTVIEHLKTKYKFKDMLINQIKSDKLGFVRKADYLYVYNQLKFTNKNKDLSESFIKQLQQSFKNNTSIVRKSIYKSITQNNLGYFLLKHSKNDFNKLQKKFLKSHNGAEQIQGNLLTLHSHKQLSLQNKNRVINNIVKIINSTSDQRLSQTIKYDKYCAEIKPKLSQTIKKCYY